MMILPLQFDTRKIRVLHARDNCTEHDNFVREKI